MRNMILVTIVRRVKKSDVTQKPGVEYQVLVVGWLILKLPD